MIRGKIWQLVDSQAMGGIEEHIHILTKELINKGNDTQVVLMKDYDFQPLRDLLQNENIPIMHMPPSLSGMLDMLRMHSPCLVHTHGYKAGIIGRFLSKIVGIPSISTYHNGDMGQGKLRFYTELDAFTGFLGKSIAVSEEIAERLPYSCTVINNFTSIPQKIACNENNSKIIAFVGRLSPEKSPEIFCKMSQSIPFLQFRVYGDGPMREALESQFGDSARFFGMVNNMHDHWKDIGMLCMPSQKEGLPLAALEAMAHKVPVIAFSVGDLPQLITNEENGYIIKTGDIKALTNGIIAHFNKDAAEREDIANNARNTISSDYSIDQGLDRVLQLYDQVLNKKKRVRQSIFSTSS